MDQRISIVENKKSVDNRDNVDAFSDVTIVERSINDFNAKMAEKLVDEQGVVHIIGAFSAGKSRLVRELLCKHQNAQHLLPISSLERQTVLPLEITYGDTPCLSLINSGISKPMSSFPSHNEQQSFEVGVCQLRLEIPEPSLLLGNVKLISAEEGIKRLVLKDMPGWNSGDSRISEDPLTHGLVGTDNISLVYVVNANRVDNQGDLARLQAIFEAVASVDAFFYNGFNFVVVVTRCDNCDEQFAIKERINDRLKNLAKQTNIEDFTVKIFCVDFGKEQELLNHEAFTENFWEAILNPIATKKNNMDSLSWTSRINNWPIEWQIQSKLTASLDLIKDTHRFITNFKKDDKYILHMNKTRLLGLSDKERQIKIFKTWEKQVGSWEISTSVIERLRLKVNHPLAMWWHDYWLTQLQYITKKVDILFETMFDAINQIPPEVDDMQSYFSQHVEDLYQQATETLRNHFCYVCEAIEPLQHDSDKAKVVATLLSLSMLDATYSDYYNSMKSI